MKYQLLGLAVTIGALVGAVGEATCRTNAIDGVSDEAEKPSVDYGRLDPSCADVNEAYIKTHSTYTYSVSLQKLEANGTLKPFIVSMVSGNLGFERYVFSKKWKRFDASLWTVKDRDSPKFTDCWHRGDVVLDGVRAKYISTKWHQFPFIANMEIWISTEHGRLLRTVRHYDKPLEFSSASILEVYDYDPESANPPPADVIQ